MKRRHIKSAGYKMVNLPFWRYNMDYKADKQEQIVKTYLQKMGLRIKKEKEVDRRTLLKEKRKK